MPEFTNTFQGGMHKDNSPAFQPKGTYRHAQDVHIISQDGNNYSIKDALGNVHTFTIDIPYDETTSDLADPPTILAFVSFPDSLYCFFSNGISSDGFGGIAKIDYYPYGSGIDESSFTPIYWHEDLDFNLANRIEGVGIPENDDRRRIYWTDNHNNPRVINVSNSVFTSFKGAAQLTTGVRYMVTRGAITHNATTYGPGLTDGNIFTAVGTTYTVADGTPLVIEYYPYELFDWSPARTLGRIKFNSYGSGEVYYGGKVYLYRLGLEDEGIWTSWSYPSSPIHVTAPNTPAYQTITDPYHDTVGDGTSSTLVQSEKSVFININEVDINYDRIQVACIEFDQSSTTPRQITIVCDENITSSSMTLEHTGQHLGDLTADDLTEVDAHIEKVKTITTNKNYLLAANITEREELDLDHDFSTGVTITSFEYPMPIMGDLDSCSNVHIFDPVVPVAGANPSATTVVPDSRYVVTLGEAATNTVTYNGNTYLTGEVIVGVSGQTSITTAGTGEVRPCVHKNKYTPTGTSDRVEDYIEIPDNDEFWDYKSATVSHFCRGYWSGETYRFGVLFYDLKGNPYYVRWLIDYTMPTITAKSGLIIARTYSGAPCYSLNPSGVKISGLTIPATLVDQISGFSIVRAPRDRRIITQGLVTQCYFDSGTPNIYRPVGWATPDGQEGGASALAGPDSSSTSYYCYICPDHLVGFDLGITLGADSSNTIEMAGWLDGHDYDGAWAKTISGDDSTSQVTFFDPLTGDTKTQSKTVNFWKELDEGEEVSEPDWDGADNKFENKIGTNTSASGFAEVNDDCAGGSGSLAYNSSAARGGKKIVFTVEGGEIEHYSTTTAYNDSSLGSDERKILMNYCVDNPNPYGGEGAGAKANTVYMTTGHYQEINSDVLADVQDGLNYTFNDIEIFGGDCFVSLIDYTYALFDDDFVTGFAQSWFFPCETNVNYALRRGRKVSNVSMYPSGGGGTGEDIVYNLTGTARLEEYSYNPGYSAVGDNILYPALPVDLVGTIEHPTRIRFAGPRAPSTKIDTFRNFQPLDFKDLDGAGGRINKIAVKNGRVIVWQDLMTGTVPVLERILLGGETATSLGTGGVVDRFDIIKSDFGTQHQWSVIEADYGFLWFDMRRKAVMVMDSGIGEISQILGLKSYFDEIFLEGDASTALSQSQLLNSPSFAVTSDQPLKGIGATGVYDPKLKTTYLTLKFRFLSNSGFNYVSKDFTIGYYHPTKAFVGFFSFQPGIAHHHNGFVFACNIPRSRSKYYGTNMSSTDFVVGDIVPHENAEWVCISPLTIASYPGNANQVPDFAGSTFWTKVNQINQIWVNNQPATLGQATVPDYQYNKWFGLATTSELHFVVNPGATMNVQHIEQVGNNVYPTEVTVESSNQTASDTNVQSWNTNFRYIWDRLTHSMPLSDTGRVVGDYAIIKLIKKNWSSNPTTVSTSVKIINYIKSFFVPKR